MNRKYLNLFGITYVYSDYDHGGLKPLNIEALNFSFKANLIRNFYLNPKWFTSRLMEYAHPLCKNSTVDVVCLLGYFAHHRPIARN